VTVDFVMIANDWAAGRDNPTSKHRIAVELARRGRRVLWIEGSGMRRPRLGSGADRSRIARKVVAALRPPRPTAAVGGAIQTLSPLLLPWPTSRLARAWNGRYCAAVGRFWARRLGLREPALVNYVPVLAGALAAWRGRRVYHCVDRWDAFGMYDGAVMAAMDERCCRAADVVVTSSHELFERCRRFNPRTYLVMHGVDHEHFAKALAFPPRPADLPAGRVVGFFGLISEWVDQELVARLARELRGGAGQAAEVVLIGAADVPAQRLAAEPNVRLLGPRPFRDLPAYAARFEVGIIPFVVNDLTRAVNPIKLREMMAAGVPVVATALPEVARYAEAAGGGVEVACDADEFTARVKRRLEWPLAAAARRALSDSVRGETWEEKVREILEIVEAA
jgi:glycosyltransferase involved in cell wall biosynthesis